VSILLRIAAVYSLAWAIGLACPELLPGGAAAGPAARATGYALAVANLAYAVLFWTAAMAPKAYRLILYVALLVFGLRGAIGTYQVLYVLDGGAAVLQLIDMVLSVAAFVGMLNLLPGELGVGRARQP
jgi:heme A synthase